MGTEGAAAAVVVVVVGDLVADVAAVDVAVAGIMAGGADTVADMVEVGGVVMVRVEEAAMEEEAAASMEEEEEADMEEEEADTVRVTEEAGDGDC